MKNVWAVINNRQFGLCSIDEEWWGLDEPRYKLSFVLIGGPRMAFISSKKPPGVLLDHTDRVVKQRVCVIVRNDLRNRFPKKRKKR